MFIEKISEIGEKTIFFKNFYSALCYNVTSTNTNDITVTITSVHNSTPGLPVRLQYGALSTIYYKTHTNFYIFITSVLYY